MTREQLIKALRDDAALDPTMTTAQRQTLLAAADMLEADGVPVACMVETEQGTMVWPIADYAEAGTYCDEDEFPVKLYTAPQPAIQAERVPLTDGQTELCLQWFNAVQDLNPAYLDSADFVLAKSLYDRAGRRVPASVAHGIVGNKQ